MSCCTDTCCGPGSYCCQHTAPHTHDEEPSLLSKRISILRRWVGLKAPSASPPPPTVEETLRIYKVTRP